MNERNSHHLGDEGTDGYKNQDVAGAFVNKCQISDPKVLSVALPVKSRQWQTDLYIHGQHRMCEYNSETKVH